MADHTLGRALDLFNLDAQPIAFHKGQFDLTSAYPTVTATSAV
jgi:hypothetical protein